MVLLHPRDRHGGRARPVRVTSPVTFPITSRAGKVMLHAVLLVYSAGVVPLQLSFWYTVRRRERGGRERERRERKEKKALS